MNVKVFTMKKCMAILFDSLSDCPTNEVIEKEYGTCFPNEKNKKKGK